MEQNMYNEQAGAKYPPLPRKPMKVSGVLGVTWQLFKRGFFSMLGFNAVMVGIPSALVFALIWNAIARFAFQSGPRLEQALFAIGPILIICLLIGLVVTLFVAPAQMGATYLEMNDRLDGNKRTFGGLFRAISPGLKKTYSTYWTVVLLAVGVGVVLSIIQIITVLPRLFAESAWRSYQTMPEAPPFSFLTSIIMSIMGIILNIALLAAIVEKKRAFAGIGRAFQLYFRNFGHALGASMLYLVILFGISLVIGLLALLAFLPMVFRDFMNSSRLAQSILLSLPVIFALAGVFELVLLPYSYAFTTALFTDLKAREDFKAQGAMNGVPLPPAPQAPYAPQALQAPPPQAQQEPPAPEKPLYEQPSQSHDVTTTDTLEENPWENKENQQDDHYV